MDGVDMETSAVFALAEFRGVRAASLLIVSDELKDLGHNRGFNHPRMPEVLAEYFMPFIKERA
jgi:purine-nucleoside phosphorylase